MATLRTPVALADLQSRYSTEQLLVVKLDVTRPDEIEAAFAQAKAVFGRIDVVYNNAGLIVVGEIEGTPDEQARTEFEVRHSVHLFSNPFLTVLRQGSIFRRRKRIQDVDEILPREQADWWAPYPSFVCWRPSSSSWCWLLLCSVSSQSPEDANFLLINVRQKGCNR